MKSNERVEVACVSVRIRIERHYKHIHVETNFFGLNHGQNPLQSECDEVNVQTQQCYPLWLYNSIRFSEFRKVRVT